MVGRSQHSCLHHHHHIVESLPQRVWVWMFYFLCSCLASNLVMTFMPDLLMCRSLCWIYWYVGHRATNVVAGLRADVFLTGFGNLPVQGRCCQNFQLFFTPFTFLSCHSHPMPSLFFILHRGRRPTMSEGRQDRTTCYAHLDRRRDRKLGRPNPRRHRTLHRRCEPPSELFLCIELVNFE